MTNSDVQASIRYLVPTDERPIYIASQAGADAALNIGAQFEERTVTVYDARQLQTPASLDKQGFSLAGHATRVENFLPVGGSAGRL